MRFEYFLLNSHAVEYVNVKIVRLHTFSGVGPSALLFLSPIALS